MRLYNYWRSGSSWRVRIALAWKKIPYEYVAVNLVRDGGEQYREPYSALNPQSQVPLLELDPEGGAAPRRIAQSVAIIEYLEERWPAPPLLPADPWRRARARQLAEVINSGIQPFQNTPVLAHVKEVLRSDEKAWVQYFHARGLAALERTAAETAGTFLVGDEPSLADVFLVPQLFGARRFALDLAPYPTLLRVETACKALPAFAAAEPERQPDAVAAAVTT
jgi:maleylpyruvate isomerase